MNERIKKGHRLLTMAFFVDRNTRLLSYTKLPKDILQQIVIRNLTRDLS